MSRKILILYAHPAPSRSQLNAPFAAASAAAQGVELVDLYAEYPRFDIDVAKEQQRVKACDVLIFQYPLYWYAAPALLKQWQDTVMGHGFAYGPEAESMAGKIMLCAVTTGGPEAAFRPDGLGHFSLRDLLHPLEQTANMCGMIWLPPFAIFGAKRVMEQTRLQHYIDEWLRLLAALREDRLDLERAARASRLNSDLDLLIEEAAA